MAFPLKKIPLQKVDCRKVNEIISNSYNNDQYGRENHENLRDVIDVNKENKNTIISIIDKCGW